MYCVTNTRLVKCMTDTDRQTDRQTDLTVCVTNTWLVKCMATEVAIKCPYTAGKDIRVSYMMLDDDDITHYDETLVLCL